MIWQSQSHILTQSSWKHISPKGMLWNVNSSNTVDPWTTRELEAPTSPAVEDLRIIFDSPKT